MAPQPKPLAERFWSKVDVRGPDDCWEWIAAKINGYGKIRLDGGKLSKHKGAHAVAYELAHGPIPEGLQANHKCDNPGCCNPRHIYAGTSKQNMEDKVSRGRHNCVRGEDHGMSKLNELKVLSIRDDGRTHSVIAGDYGVDRRLIGMIKRRQRWAHVATK